MEMEEEIEILDLYDDKKEEIETTKNNTISIDNPEVFLEENSLLDHLVVSKGYWFVVFFLFVVIGILFFIMFK